MIIEVTKISYVSNRTGYVIDAQEPIFVNSNRISYIFQSRKIGKEFLFEVRLDNGYSFCINKKDLTKILKNTPIIEITKNIINTNRGEHYVDYKDKYYINIDKISSIGDQLMAYKTIYYEIRLDGYGTFFIDKKDLNKILKASK